MSQSIASLLVVTDSPTLTVDDVDLSDLAFWGRPPRERFETFALLRSEAPIAFFAEPDFGDATTVNGKRTITNVAPQALFAMNSEFSFEHARKLAETLLAMKDGNDARSVEAAYTKILNRAPSADEVDSSLTYIEKYSAKYGGKTPQLEAWQSLCHILLSSNEFLYLD